MKRSTVTQTRQCARSPGCLRVTHFEPRGAYFEAKANLALGRLRPAERRLEATLARGGPGLGQVFSLLGHIYEIQARFDDARTLLLARLYWRG